jgi:type II restriction enzyme
MEALVECYLKKAGVKYYKEMDLTEIEHKYHIDLSLISVKGISAKRWDFIVKTPTYIYAIETNFYASGGSKLNETARSYKMIAEEAKRIKNFKFIWITDGGGWKHSRRNLEETFNVLEDLYNIADMENGIFEIVLK